MVVLSLIFTLIVTLPQISEFGLFLASVKKLVQTEEQGNFAWFEVL